ncbi:MAG: pyruvate, phosphate dikinase [Planctomycetes bacterium]|nr:pyruvate, phosphate dikinase [Planctomycetota bacterium]
MKKYLYFFGGKKTEGNGKLKDILGGKGANLAEMARLGLPVPPGFTVSTELCRIFYENKMKFPATLQKEFINYVRKLETASGKKFGDTVNPLLVSVRSGAKFSMPGMMDTILNLGLNDATVQTLIKLTKNESFVYDCYKRLLMMFGDVVLDIERKIFETVKSDGPSTIARYKDIILKHSGQPFPQDPIKQLEMARDAVFRSWNNQRAITYRNLYKISHDIGTAVNIQMMVFGNMGNDSATGVGFTRNPATGEKMFYGEYLTNAQGEDVVAGIRTPKPITELGQDMPAAFKQLKDITSRLELHYKDIQDFEFTIERAKLYMLQTRSGKRTGLAAIRIAVDMVKEKLIKPDEAVRRVEPLQLNQLLHPMFNPVERPRFKVIAKGLNASPGAASGKVYFSPDKVVEQAAKGERTILVRKETSPDDISGMYKAKGVLTATGGMTSHAAVVGRQMGKPSVVGCSALKVDEEKKLFSVGNVIVREGDYLSIDGATGEVMMGDVPTMESEVMQVIKGKLSPDQAPLYQYFATLLAWADKIRHLKVRANADIPLDAEYAMKFGAEGIGLCRTEHMFFAEDRLPIVQEMILATNKEDRVKALNKLLPLQRSDFKGLFETMKGYPVTIRTIDPPLHEFLPKREELMVEVATLKAQNCHPEHRSDHDSELGSGSNEMLKQVQHDRSAILTQKERLLARVNELHEFNPMMGHRGCRLGIVYPEITEMQVRAILEAASEVAKAGKTVVPEIMIPLVGHINEFTNQAMIVHRVASEVAKKTGIKIKYLVGTMIEIPRAAITADEIATQAQFFSFGTNDLTQMTFGFSRDDAGKFLHYYVDNKILANDPFVTIDQGGVGKLIRMATEKGRTTRPDLKVGICGEHGGDPESVIFCHSAGLNYVSASPFRVPIARLAAAHACLR